VPVLDGRRSAPGGSAETTAPTPAGPDRVRQGDRGRRAGHAVRQRAAARAVPDDAAERGPRGRGGAGRLPAPTPAVLADVRAAVVRGPPGQPTGRRRLAPDAGRPVPRRRRLPRRPDVHADRRDGRLRRVTVGLASVGLSIPTFGAIGGIVIITCYRCFFFRYIRGVLDACRHTGFSVITVLAVFTEVVSTVTGKYRTTENAENTLYRMNTAVSSANAEITDTRGIPPTLRRRPCNMRPKPPGDDRAANTRFGRRENN